MILVTIPPLCSSLVMRRLVEAEVLMFDTFDLPCLAHVFFIRFQLEVTWTDMDIRERLSGVYAVGVCHV